MIALAPAALVLMLNVVGLQSVCGGTVGAECRQLPANVRASRPMRPVLADLLNTSSIFRKQCATIAAAPRLRVDVDLTTLPMGPLTRARARAARYDTGLIVVAIEIPAASDYVELIVHEFEHVTELIESVDFRTLTHSSAVWQRVDGTFETERAQNAGRAASVEVHGDVDPIVAAAGRLLRLAARSTWRAIRWRGKPNQASSRFGNTQI